jgi:hypothetical protein
MFRFNFGRCKFGAQAVECSAMVQLCCTTPRITRKQGQVASRDDFYLKKVFL